MPSVRVRNSPFISIQEIYGDRTTSQGPSLTPRDNRDTLRLGDRPNTLHVPSRNDESSNSNDIPLTSHVPEGNWRSRRRSSSRIQSHVLSTRSSFARSYPWSTEAQPSASSSTDVLNPTGSATPLETPNIRNSGLLTLEGSQTDIAIASDGSPGILERNFVPAYMPPRSPRFQDEDHHDDIVEHLDVIDPQVGTVSNLTNAANSIVLPPLGFSRKPVIVLSAPNRPRQDAEKEQFSDALDRHVDDVLQSPSKFRRTMLGIWSFLKTPMGILTGIYGFLVVFWGAAIVFFLAKFINFHNANTQGFWVEVSSQTVCGLFTVTSVGFIPSRILSTYRIWKIWKYKRETIKRRKAANLPQLFDMDDLPDPVYDSNFVRVLSDEEHKDLHRQQVQFAYHQTWYRPHGTETHRAFPISMALWICVLNDWNSIFQVVLCGTMWGLNRFQRPAWSTGVLIPAGFLCGIGAAVLIWRGGERTKRVEEVRERLLAALATEIPPQSKQVTIRGSISRRVAVPVTSADHGDEQEQHRRSKGRSMHGTVKRAERPLPLPPHEIPEPMLTN